MGLEKMEMLRKEKSLTEKVIIIIFSIIIICVFVIVIFLLKDNRENQLIIGDEKLAESFIKIYDISDNRKVYSQFTSVQYIDEGKEQFSLGEVLRNNVVSLDDILAKSNYYDGLNDGGSVVYYFRKERNAFVNKDFEIVCCDTLDGVKDIYIIEQFDFINSICEKR